MTTTDSQGQTVRGFAVEAWARGTRFVYPAKNSAWLTIEQAIGVMKKMQGRGFATTALTSCNGVEEMLTLQDLEQCLNPSTLTTD